MSINTHNQQTARQHNSLTEHLTNGHEWAYSAPESRIPSTDARTGPAEHEKPQPVDADQSLPTEPRESAGMEATPPYPAAEPPLGFSPAAHPTATPRSRWHLAKGAVLGSAAAILVVGLGSGAAIGWAMGSAAAAPDGFGTMQPGELPGGGEFGGPPAGGQGSGGQGSGSQQGQLGQSEQGESEQGFSGQSSDGSTGSGSDYEPSKTQDFPALDS
ncbi:hypothetical protein [Lysinibacter cavernae]|uniref:Uncharacterized protein n=1 Tax=Lysinibacter cavernae TaxID=1640652 RepID=A0A7X5TSV5_9MICO|nr:hypothetical protein [Lysinibacter cavernae]NIH53931.1 hypothetical protein [Lysinibacter cavernae]